MTINYSVLLPHRDLVAELRKQLGTLTRILETLEGAFEIIIIDDGSPERELLALQALLATDSRLRLVRIDARSGASVALSAGMNAARGEIIITVAAGMRYPCQQIPSLLARLARADMAFGKVRRRGWAKLGQRLSRIPRWFLLGSDNRDPEHLFWAARREAIAGMELQRGMARYLASFVALRGFRVDEVPIECQACEPSIGDGWANPGDLLAAWWRKRRYRRHHAHEITTSGEVRLPAPHWLQATDSASKQVLGAESISFE